MFSNGKTGNCHPIGANSLKKMLHSSETRWLRGCNAIFRLVIERGLVTPCAPFLQVARFFLPRVLVFRSRMVESCRLETRFARWKRERRRLGKREKRSEEKHLSGNGLFVASMKESKRCSSTMRCNNWSAVVAVEKEGKGRQTLVSTDERSFYAFVKARNEWIDCSRFRLGFHASRDV